MLSVVMDVGSRTFDIGYCPRIALQMNELFDRDWLIELLASADRFALDSVTFALRDHWRGRPVFFICRDDEYGEPMRLGCNANWIIDDSSDPASFNDLTAFQSLKDALTVFIRINHPMKEKNDGSRSGSSLLERASDNM
jgi:hypothetical protein